MAPSVIENEAADGCHSHVWTTGALRCHNARNFITLAAMRHGSSQGLSRAGPGLQTSYSTTQCPKAASTAV